MFIFYWIRVSFIHPASNPASPVQIALLWCLPWLSVLIICLMHYYDLVS